MTYFPIVLGLADGLKPRFYNLKVQSNFRKVLVEEVRFGVCSGALRNSSSKNDKIVDRYKFDVNVAQEVRPLPGTLEGKRDKEKNKGHRTKDKGRKPRKRFAVRYECPTAEKLDPAPEYFLDRDGSADAKPDGVFLEEHIDGKAGSTDSETGSSKLAKIVGGDIAYNSWPSLASIQYLGIDLEWHHFCGGSLIHAHWVVTAAHCVTQIEDRYIRVVLGDYQLSKFSHREQVIDPARIFMHKYFNKTTYDFDIALIKLQTNARPTKYVSTMDVATEQEVEELDHTAICYIAGWGNIVGSTTELFLSDQLQQSRMWIMSQSLCQLDSDNQICVYSDEASACKGDSGGPLVCSVDGDWVLVGAASYIVSQTCEPMSPNVYTRISSYVYWMASVIHQYDTELFNP